MFLLLPLYFLKTSAQYPLSLPSPPSHGHMSKQPSSTLHDGHTLVVSREE